MQTDGRLNRYLLAESYRDRTVTAYPPASDVRELTDTRQGGQPGAQPVAAGAVSPNAGLAVRLALADEVRLEAHLAIPPGATDVILFSHAGGIGRDSPRDATVAAVLGAHGFGTLRLNLVTADEEREDALVGTLRNDVALLAERLGAVTDLIATRPDTEDLRRGYVANGNGTAAALMAAAEHPSRVGAIVSYGGRPDLADASLWRVHAPTLLIAGDHDHELLALNRAAMDDLQCLARLERLQAAGDPFEDPDALARVGRLAFDWFRAHLR